MGMIQTLRSREFSRFWTAVLIAVSLGKAFIAGAGLGLAALGIVDIAGTLGVRPLVEFIQHEHILDVFAIGGGIVSTGLQIIWKVVSR